MGAMKRELERIAEALLVADYDATLEELQKLEELGPLNAHFVANILDFMKVVSPMCECGNDYFEHLREINT